MKLGEHVSEETKKKLSDARKRFCAFKDRFPLIPSLCLCGCGGTIWKAGIKFKSGHHGLGKTHTVATKNKMSDTRKRISASKVRFPLIPSLCLCGCGETVWKWGNRFRKGHSSRIKGLKHFSKEACNRLSVLRKGWIPWNKGKVWLEHRGKGHPRYGKHHTDDAIKKMTPTFIKKGTHFNPKGEIKKGQHVSPKTEFKSGEASPFWRGGISFKPYCPKFNGKLKESIRKRDNNTCQLCGAKQNGEKLSVHHVHYDKENCEPDLIALCRGCNSKVNNHKDYYENLFIENLTRRCLLWQGD